MNTLDDDIRITAAGDDVTNPQAKLPLSARGKTEESMGLGIFADADPLPVMEDAQKKADAGIVSSMRTHPTIEVGGVKLNTVSMETLAMLQAINSPFVSFIPVLQPSERADLQKLAKQKMGMPEDDKLEGEELEKAVAQIKPLTEEEDVYLDELSLKAKEENAQFTNPTLSILVFFAIHDPALGDVEREEMVFDEPKRLRSHALSMGRYVPMQDLEELGREIGQAIEDAKSTKVVPVSKDKEPPMGNK